jgi:ankyrin repeat protein
MNNSDYLSLQERLRVFITECAELPDWVGTPPIDIHSRNLLGDTLLQVAAGQGDIQAVTDLLRAGADLNIRGEYGQTPLLEAVGQRHFEVVRLLLAHGASVAERNDWGCGPADIARLHSDDLMLDLLNGTRPNEAPPDAASESR